MFNCNDTKRIIKIEDKELEDIQISTLRKLIKLTKNHVNEIKLCIMTVWKAFIKNRDIMKSICLKCKVVKACAILILMLI